MKTVGWLFEASYLQVLQWRRLGTYSGKEWDPCCSEAKSVDSCSARSFTDVSSSIGRSIFFNVPSKGFHSICVQVPARCSFLSPKYNVHEIIIILAEKVVKINLRLCCNGNLVGRMGLHVMGRDCRGGIKPFRWRKAQIQARL